MLPSETMIWQPEFTDKTLSRKPGAVQSTAELNASSASGVSLYRVWDITFSSVSKEEQRRSLYNHSSLVLITLQPSVYIMLSASTYGGGNLSDADSVLTIPTMIQQLY